MRTIVVAALLMCGATFARAQTFDPAHHFRTLRTEHFIIYFHEGEDALAARLAPIAEDTWHRLAAPFGVTPPALTHVLLVDETELANGYATPLPRDTIAIFPVWPAGSDLLRTDDWLRLDFTHEFTHIVHLDRSEGWARIVRDVFGRSPIAFPNLLLPIWQIEGLAVYEESVVTGDGRLDAGDFRAIVNEAARAHRLEPIDRANGGLTDWPGGETPYAYGTEFTAYLADHYGIARLAVLADETAHSLPYLGSGAFRRVYGKPLGALWREYEDSVRAAVSAPQASDGARRLTHHDFTVTAPRFAPPACAACPADLYYAVVDADRFPALYSLRLDGTSTPVRAAMRYLGSTAGVGRDTVYFDQLELSRNTSLYSDLYSLDRASGRVRQLTSQARLADPDLSPDEHTIVAVQNRRPSERDLVLVTIGRAGAPSTVTPLVANVDTQFNAPRWSPDGRLIAVSRQRLHAQPEIVIVDVATGAVRVVASAPNMRWVTPAWRRDGGAIVAAADVGDGPFNLYEVDPATGGRRQLSHTTGGATWPDVSPDGKTIVYVGYTADGFDLYEMPYPPAGATSALSPTTVDTTTLTPAGAAPLTPADLSRVRNYSPWPTLWPVSWTPIVTAPQQQLRAGAGVSGSDVLGYHAYSASATWALSSPATAPAGSASGPDWSVAYAYQRRRPILFADASRQTSFFAGPPSDSGLPSTATLHERKVEAGVEFVSLHTRASQAATISFLRAVDDYTLAIGPLSLNHAAMRASWWLATAHLFGNSISFERGVDVGVTAETIRRALGSSGDATTVTGDAHLYLPGFGLHHVIALRVGGGSTTGDLELGRVFLLGGAASNLNPTDFDSSAFTLLRGFPTDTFAGTHIVVMNADYRFPIAKIERGLGTWPIFVHTIHASFFADAGNVWTTTFLARNFKTSIGAELSANVVLGYRVPFTATVGAAYGRDGSHLVANGTTIYARLGYAF